MRLHLARDLSIDLDSPRALSDGFRAFVCGESGAGKSFAAASVIGQVVEQGAQAVVLDAHGEYGSLVSLGTGVHAIGYTEDAEPVREDMLDGYMALFEEGRSLLFDLKDWTDLEPEQLDAFVFQLLRRIYTSLRRRPRRVFLLVEEAQNFAPQERHKGVTPQVRLFTGIATGGRKYGLNTLFCTQRPALISKHVISQCNVRLFFRISDARDWKEVREYLPEDGVRLDGTGDVVHLSYTDFSRLENGQAVALSRYFDPRLVALLPPLVAPAKGLPAFLRR